MVVAHTLKGQERKAGKQNTAGYAGIEQIGPELALAGAGVVNNHAPERHQEDADDGGDHSQLDQIAVLQPQSGAGQQTGGRQPNVPGGVDHELYADTAHAVRGDLLVRYIAPLRRRGPVGFDRGHQVFDLGAQLLFFHNIPLQCR